MSLQDPFDVLMHLETALHQADARHDTSFLEQTLHPAFREFGRSGREYDRHTIITALTSEESSPVTWAQDFHAQRLDDRAVLLTYRSAHLTDNGDLERYTNRSSVWLQTPTGWQMVFHQGTPTDAFPKSLPHLPINLDAERPFS